MVKESYMRKLFLTLSILYFNITLYSQIDTSDYFPLQNGNRWEYSGMQSFSSDLAKVTVAIKGDTLLNNGKMYKIIQRNIYSDSVSIGATYYYYFRKDSNKIYKYGGDSQSCDSIEYIYYNFGKTDSSIWPICPTYYANYRGVHSSKMLFISLANTTTEVLTFDYVNVSSKDTVWAPMSSPTTESVAKGIGIIAEMDWDFAFLQLYGMVINGKTYGHISSIADMNNFTRSYSLYQNYPNPFNPITIIKYSIPLSGLVSIKVFDILGREIKTLVNSYKTAGPHEIMFNGDEMNSGVYIYRLKAGTFLETKKMILLK